MRGPKIGRVQFARGSDPIPLKMSHKMVVLEPSGLFEEMSAGDCDLTLIWHPHQCLLGVSRVCCRISVSIFIPTTQSLVAGPSHRQASSFHCDVDPAAEMDMVL